MPDVTPQPQQALPDYRQQIEAEQPNERELTSDHPGPQQPQQPQAVPSNATNPSSSSDNVTSATASDTVDSQTQQQSNQTENATTPEENLTIQQQARVATVIYDMLIRGGQNAATLTEQLSQAYPNAAALAQGYAAHVSSTIFQPLSNARMQYPQRTQESNRRDFVLRRISVSSVAWFCCFVGAAFASFRLWFIFLLALGATLANNTDNDILYHLVEYLANQTLDKGPKRELYKWMFNLLNEENPVVAINHHGPMAGASTTLMPDHIAAALLLTPITAGLLSFLLGGLSAFFVNVALRAAGGIRFENHEE